MPDGTVMGGSDSMATAAASASAAADRPSSAAAMICSNETAGTVQTTFSLAKRPRRTATWSGTIYRCDYTLPAAGVLKLTVADLDQAGPGRAWFEQLRSRLSGATALTGMENFGFPAFETGAGDVVFLKDHKTLWVDATGLRRAGLPDGFNRSDVAYHVAAAVIACWNK